MKLLLNFPFHMNFFVCWIFYGLNLWGKVNQPNYLKNWLIKEQFIWFSFFAWNFPVISPTTDKHHQISFKMEQCRRGSFTEGDGLNPIVCILFNFLISSNFVISWFSGDFQEMESWNDWNRKGGCIDATFSFVPLIFHRFSIVFCSIPWNYIETHLRRAKQLNGIYSSAQFWAACTRKSV